MSDRDGNSRFYGPSVAGLFLTIFAVPVSARAGEPPPKGVPEPLPNGAVARLGTARFRTAPFFAPDSFAPNGRALLTSRDAAGLLNLDSGVIERSFYFAREPVYMSPPVVRGNRLFVVDGKTLRVFDTNSGREVTSWDGLPVIDNGVRISPLSVSADGATVAFGCERPQMNGASGRAMVLRLGEKVVAQEFEVVQRAWVWAVISPNGKTLVTGGAEGVRDPNSDAPAAVCGQIQVWDVATGRERYLLDTGETYAGTVVFFSDSTRVVAVDGDGHGVIWDLGTKKKVCSLETVVGAARPVSWTFSRDGKWVANLESSGRVLVWDAATGKHRAAHAPPELPPAIVPRGKLLGDAIEYTPDGRLTGLGRWGEAVATWDAEQGRFLTPVSGYPSLPLTMRFAPDGKSLYLAMAGIASPLNWTLSGGEPTVVSIRPRDLPSEFVDDGFVEAISPDCRTFVLGRAGRWGGSALICDLKTGRVLQKTEPVNLERSDERTVYSPTGEFLVRGGSYRWEKGAPPTYLPLFDVKTGKQVKSPEVEVPERAVCGFSPDGSRLIVIQPNGRARPRAANPLKITTWDLRTKEKLSENTVDGLQPWPYDGLHVLGNGWTILLFHNASDGGYTVSEFEADTGDRAVRGAITGGASSPSPLLLSPDRRRMAVGGMEKNVPVIRLYAIPSYKLVTTLRGHGARVLEMAFSADSSLLATASEDTTVLVWKVQKN